MKKNPSPDKFQSPKYGRRDPSRTPHGMAATAEAGADSKRERKKSREAREREREKSRSEREDLHSCDILNGLLCW